MISANSILGSNPFESQIQQILQLDGLKRASLEQEKSDVQAKKTALSDISSSISSLDTLLTSFTQNPTENLNPLTGTSSNADAIFVVSTSGLKRPANFDISINQLAKQDRATSAALANTGNDLSASGKGSFDIAIGGNAPITITLDTSNLTNEEVLNAVSDQINQQLGDDVTASVFNLDGSNSKLSFKSTKTGEEFRISFSNVQGDFASLNLTNTFTADQLNAKFNLDGINFERSTNLINDAIEGLSFELKQTTTATEKLTIERDIDEAKESINSFIKTFNEANSLIRSKTFVDGENNTRGPLSNQRGIRNLSFNLRQESTREVSSLAGNSISTLANIGIELQQDGSMEITDSAKLDEVLQNNPKELEQLFTADDGLIAGLQQTTNLFMTGDNAIFDGIESGFDSRIERLDDRIENEDDFLQRREEQLREEFTRLQQIIDQGNSQLNRVLSFQNSLGF